MALSDNILHYYDVKKKKVSSSITLSIFKDTLPMYPKISYLYSGYYTYTSAT